MKTKAKAIYNRNNRATPTIVVALWCFSILAFIHVAANQIQVPEEPNVVAESW